ncbi:hypothetical protein [Arthrobacter sp. OAP107]|uniref:hypothetical protein n=1 Tax=Arthrobacter sp. OAP107 TaxID=3156445 RepID=UPI0033992FB1
MERTRKLHLWQGNTLSPFTGSVAGTGTVAVTSPRAHSGTCSVRRPTAQRKKHNAAVICPARRRCDVIYSMLRHGTFYEEIPAVAA